MPAPHVPAAATALCVMNCRRSRLAWSRDGRARRDRPRSQSPRRLVRNIPIRDALARNVRRPLGLLTDTRPPICQDSFRHSPSSPPSLLESRQAPQSASTTWMERGVTTR